MPGDGRFLDLYRASLRALGISLVEIRTHLHVVPENLLHLAHPAHIQSLGHVDKLVIFGRAHKAAVLCRQAKILDVAPVFLQEIAIAARDEVDDIVGVLGESRDDSASSLGWDGLGGNFDNRGESTLESAQPRSHTYVIVEEHQPLLRALVCLP